ncbi:NAD(P)-dependent dehydrogenase (short-subunit alcohol dehydrogenase family) [Nocardia tenerifensis]|uniref:NAD(P)-dependent dehydrogenase (Short-subunit alcohol dehydrogenase family) n=1 Tax=Nocardia tenerifensis TaxID=228006 RepID=A0A318K5I4_9NOCA|nr:SDR family oxidoreductase [Nocardia tenerifensis]PXX66710.1 NAD(P)-dependent dehydrogenase (short-subunit alcohol dehydrogenase family) [Nocardia tenerifensis]
MDMLLENKNVVVYGAGGAVGGAVARGFAREGARVFLTGRNAERVGTVAKEISAGGGAVETAVVDALDEESVAGHLDAVVADVGRIDVSFNAIGISPRGLQGIPFTDLPVENFMRPITTYAQAHFVIAKSAARHMIPQKSGVILMHTPEPARVSLPLVGGMSVGWAAMEALNRALSAEWAQHGVRSVCLRTTGMVDTPTIDVVYGLHADAMGISTDQVTAAMTAMTHRKRPTALAELVSVATFLASDQAAAMTGTVANLTGGIIVD